MENKVLKLKFKVIALVSNEGNTNEKAKNLFQKFTDAGVAEYLNKNSLNQAGYEVEIENQEMFKNLNNPSVKLDDYFYAFNREDWEKRNYYKLENNKELLFKEINVDSGKKDENGEPIIITKSIDYITIEEYNKKTNPYNAGLIILGDYKCTNNDTGAFSRTTPLNHYSLMVY